MSEVTVLCASHLRVWRKHRLRSWARSIHDSCIAISLMVPSRKKSVCGGAVVIDDAVGQRDVYWGEVPAALISGWSKLAGDQVISQIEAFAALLIRWFFRKAWVGRKALFIQDNDAARFALIKASSGLASMLLIVEAFHALGSS